MPDEFSSSISIAEPPFSDISSAATPLLYIDAAAAFSAARWR
jgi:hypothetical protein